MSEPVCPRCGQRVPFEINDAISLTVHYEDYHPSVPFLTRAAEIVAAHERGDMTTTDRSDNEH